MLLFVFFLKKSFSAVQKKLGFDWEAGDALLVTLLELFLAKHRLASVRRVSERNVSAWFFHTPSPCCKTLSMLSCGMSSFYSLAFIFELLSNEMIYSNALEIF